MSLTNISKLFILSVLTFGMTVPSTVYSNVIQGKQNGIINTQLLGKWNKAVSQWPSLVKDSAQMAREMKRMGLDFDTRFEKEDRSYLLLAALQQPELLKMSVNKDVYEFRSEKNKEVILIAKVLGDNSFEFNGKAFKYDELSPLSTNVSKIISLITPENKTASFFSSLFLPSAHAEFPWMMVGVGIAGLAIGALLMNSIKTKGKNLSKGWSKLKSSTKALSRGNLGEATQDLWKATAAPAGNGEQHSGDRAPASETPPAAVEQIPAPAAAETPAVTQ